MIAIHDPRTGEQRATYEPAGAREVAAVVAGARAAAPRWGGYTSGERARLLLRLADAVEEGAARFVAAERAGTGKPGNEAANEVANAVDVLRFYAGAARADLVPAGGRRMPGRESWVRWEPLGVVAAIVPWNYPLLMAAWRIGPALAAGNAVVLKPAETTPDTAVALAELAAEILGPGVLSALPGDRDTGRLLVGSDVDAIAFTGSRAGGLDVRARAGTRRVSLELGGNAPAIVLPDAPSYTYESLVDACVYNAGQSCAAPARVITLHDSAEETVSRLARAMRARPAGVSFGPLNNRDQAARFDAILGRSAATTVHTADLAVKTEERQGFWRAGAIIADLPEDDPAVVEEIFGPVLTVQSVGTVDDALRLANGVPQALAASVWGADTGRVLALVAGINSGEVWVNCHLDQTAELPHGGRGASGNGTDLSVLALTEFQRPKTVTIRVD